MEAIGGFYRGMKVLLKPEVLGEIIKNDELPKEFSPDTVGVLDVPKNGLTNWRWLFVAGKYKIKVEEYEVIPVKR